MVSLNTLVFMICYIPCNLPANYFLDKISLRIGFTIGTLLFMIGAWVRNLGYISYNFILLG